MADSAGVKAIKQQTNIIDKLIKGNLILVANDLKGLGWLGDQEYDTIVNNTATGALQRANDLIQCVITQLEAVPTKYRDFYGVLERHLNPEVLETILSSPGGESVLHFISVCIAAWQLGLSEPI